MSTRHPLRSRAVIIAVIGLIAGALAHVGLDAAEVTWWAGWLVTVVDLLVVVGVVVGLGEQVVTPVADPRDHEGRTMAPVTQVLEHATTLGYLHPQDANSLGHAVEAKLAMQREQQSTAA